MGDEYLIPTLYFRRTETVPNCPYKTDQQNVTIKSDSSCGILQDRLSVRLAPSHAKLLYQFHRNLLTCYPDISSYLRVRTDTPRLDLLPAGESLC